MTRRNQIVDFDGKKEEIMFQLINQKRFILENDIFHILIKEASNSRSYQFTEVINDREVRTVYEDDEDGNTWEPL